MRSLLKSVLSSAIVLLNSFTMRYPPAHVSRLAQNIQNFLFSVNRGEVSETTMRGRGLRDPTPLRRLVLPVSHFSHILPYVHVLYIRNQDEGRGYYHINSRCREADSEGTRISSLRARRAGCCDLVVGDCT